jgi:hypothetical protein
VRMLQDYKNQHGHFDVRADDDAELFQGLPRFVKTLHTQVGKYQDTSEPNNNSSSSLALSQEKYQTLESMGFVESVQRKLHFDRKVELLRQYHETHGHFDMPALAEFVRRKKMEIRKYQYHQAAAAAEDTDNPAKHTNTCRLTHAQYQHLESIGFVKGVQAQENQRQQEREQNKKQKQEQQRKQNKGQQQQQPPQKPAPQKRHEKWEKLFEAVREFQKEHGGRLPKITDNLTLFKWVSYQRQMITRSAQTGTETGLTNRQIVRLTTLGINFIVKEHAQALEERAQEWLDYKQLHGKDPSSTLPIGKWAERTREKYAKWRKGEKTNLTQQLVDRLEEQGGFRWPTQAEIGQEGGALLKR